MEKTGMPDKKPCVVIVGGTQLYRMGDSATIEVSGNVVHGNDHHGIRVAGYTDFVEIKDNVIFTTEAGIEALKDEK